MKNILKIAALLGPLAVMETHAAGITLNWTAPVEMPNASTKALRITAATNVEGNKDPELQFAVLAAGLAPGSYTATVDILYVNKPDQNRSAMRGSNGDGNHYDREFSTTGALNTWFRVTGTVVVTGTDNWTGTFELKPVIFGNPGDAPDSFEIFYDNINLVDSLGASVLRSGPYDFETDTLGSEPANVTFLPGTRGDALEVGVVSLLPANPFMATIFLNSPLTQATLTWPSMAGETFDVLRSADLDFSAAPLAANVPAALGPQVIGSTITEFPAPGGTAFTDSTIDFTAILTAGEDYAFTPANGDSVGGIPVAVVSWTGNTITLAAPVGDDFTWTGPYTVAPGAETTSYLDAALPPGGKAFYRIFRK